MITLDEQMLEVAREIAMRKRVYPNWVRSGKMKQEQADYRIAALQAALDTLKTEADARSLSL